MNITSVTFVILSIITSMTFAKIITSALETYSLSLIPMFLMCITLTFKDLFCGPNISQNVQVIRGKLPNFVMDVMLCHGRDDNKNC